LVFSFDGALALYPPSSTVSLSSTYDLNPGGAAALTAAPTVEEQEDDQTIAEPKAAESSTVSEVEDAYAELRAIWQRPWCDDARADRRAFEQACEEGTPAEILDAAKLWVAAADAPRFLPPLARWLDGRGWERQPPQKARRAHARGAPRSYGRKRDISAEFFKLGSMGHAFERSAAS
jgi:hypothetical protein